MSTIKWIPSTAVESTTQLQRYSLFRRKALDTTCCASRGLNEVFVGVLESRYLGDNRLKSLESGCFRAPVPRSRPSSNSMADPPNCCYGATVPSPADGDDVLRGKALSRKKSGLPNRRSCAPHGEHTRRVQGCCGPTSSHPHRYTKMVLQDRTPGVPGPPGAPPPPRGRYCRRSYPSDVLLRRVLGWPPVVRQLFCNVPSNLLAENDSVFPVPNFLPYTIAGTIF